MQLVTTKLTVWLNLLRYNIIDILRTQTDICNVLYLVEIPYALLRYHLLMTQATFQNNGEVSPSRLFRLP